MKFNGKYRHIEPNKEDIGAEERRLNEEENENAYRTVAGKEAIAVLLRGTIESKARDVMVMASADRRRRVKASKVNA
ncbi:hypothetical protein NL676_010379 [Syzygium grande]|nr:hypothetical protein NL676_010379 [Syzygium grande]